MSNLERSRAERLDQHVVGMFDVLSRAFAAKLIEQGRVRINGEVELKAGYKLRPDDTVTVDYQPEDEPDVPNIELEVLYEDGDCVVINKPVGVLVHSKGAHNPEATVATWLRSRVKGIEGNRAGIVHRLDRATSGVMICAKTPEALSWLQKQFAQRRTKKTYMAVVTGHMNPADAIIDMPIERNPKAPATFRVGKQGKPSVTKYHTLASNDQHSLLELKPETGRTHQLRVHLAHFHHPIVGDEFYDGEKADRLYLHAAELEITILKGHERKVFSVATPQAFMEKVR